jgi:hypothetical protein
MAIDFKNGGDLFNPGKDTKQFDLENEDIVTISHTFTSTDPETIYTVPNGQTLFISKMMFINNTGGATQFQTQFNDQKGYDKNISDNDTHVLDFEIALPLTSGQTLKVDANESSGANLFVIGWLK